MPEAVDTAGLVITGEGAYDGQSAAGKVPSFVENLATRAGVPTVPIAGRIDCVADTSVFNAAVSLSVLAGSGAASLADPTRWLRDAGRAASPHGDAQPQRAGSTCQAKCKRE
ncbi:glycerate kinase [Microbacterium suwonense]|uniref:Glycerate kinase n=2 Tax=Microbacterium suwonense TaxID=683047 RepID=A0ABN6X029_9MICO|nr:glycerate kinase [Microbacterium suwonense]BDZ37991.1 hypothetical protein GCM10025863_06050 [Microbacterium suwonense]